ncbi:MAG: DUF4249 domain-containing protein [Candidatus Kapabacteria bacterium]|jgi:hypothetical protein|nr:DUF4249 domain-containing protein [Candidatus Kapabacteria bacterium]
MQIFQYHLAQAKVLRCLHPFFAAICIVLTSCTSAPQVVELPYVEQLVVSAILTAGDTVRNIHVMRSAPASGKIEYAAQGLPDARVTLLLNGSPVVVRRQRTLPQVNTQGLSPEQRTFFEAPGVVIQSGQRYSITVEWSGKRISASTVIPSAPDVVSYRILDDLSFVPPRRTLQAVVRPASNTAYSIIGETIITSNRPNSSLSNSLTESLPVVRNQVTNSDTLQIRTNLNFGFQQDTVRYFGRVVSYDPAYSLYLQSIQGVNPFARWNVQGDGVGIFVGAALSERRAVAFP